jgi:flavin reductase (DIM6/NTAB) family NADH-FMN oxidoreductase RutF
MKMKQLIDPGTVMVPCPVVLVSVGDNDKANIITLSWAANVCSDPPMIAIGVRTKRYSYELLQRTGDFVVNVPPRSLLKTAVTCGTKSGRDIDKFKVCKVTPQPSLKVKSPGIAECPLNIECKIRQVVELGSHHLFIGEVEAAHIDDKVLDAKRRPNISKMAPFTFIPLTGEYRSLGTQMKPRD